MKSYGMNTCDTTNGPGIRVSFWVSGCGHRCPGCHNPQSWDPKDGHEVTQEIAEAVVRSLKPDWIAGITWTGGDPLYPDNREPMKALAQFVRERLPHKTQWLYTGYKWEDIKDLPIIEYLDVVVDGPYVEALRDISHGYTGSRNQRIIDVKKSLKANKVVLYQFDKS